MISISMQATQAKQPQTFSEANAYSFSLHKSLSVVKSGSGGINLASRFARLAENSLVRRMTPSRSKQSKQCLFVEWLV